MVDYTSASGYVTDSQGRRQFINRNDAQGVQGTYLTDLDRNQDRNTLVAAVKASGQVPDATNDLQLATALQAASVPLFSTTVATAIDGYPKGFLVRDASGTFWVSTTDAKMTVLCSPCFSLVRLLREVVDGTGPLQTDSPLLHTP